MITIPVVMKVFDVDPEGNPEDMDDKFTCSMDDKSIPSELLKDCNIQMVITIRRSSPLSDKFKYRGVFPVNIYVEDTK